MRTRRRTTWAAAIAAVTIGAGSLSLAGVSSVSAGSKPPTVVQMGDSRLKFEINATDGDGGIQAFIDADQWTRMSIFDPGGHRIFTATAKGRMAKQGGTELFMESGEPSFDDLPLRDLLERWPEGVYTFRGRGIDGELLVGSGRLTHDLPSGPQLVSPLEDSEPQDPQRTVMTWRQVAPPNGSPIIGYQVIVSRENRLKTLPTVTLDVMMPPSSTSLAVPPGFLRPGTEYEWEVLAVEAGGNQTLSSSSFLTAG